MKQPPKESFVDDYGKRYITLAIDVMVNHGDRFFCTFRFTAPMHLDFIRGWVVDTDGLHDAIIQRYPSFAKRNDWFACLDDAKPVMPIRKKKQLLFKHIV